MLSRYGASVAEQRAAEMHDRCCRRGEDSDGPTDRVPRDADARSTPRLRAIDASYPAMDGQR